MFKESSSMEEKLKVLFDICDVNKTGAINSVQFYELLKKNLIYSEHKIELKAISKIIIIKFLINF